MALEEKELVVTITIFIYNFIIIFILQALLLSSPPFVPYPLPCWTRAVWLSMKKNRKKKKL
jgi:hypothetical protein